MKIKRFLGFCGTIVFFTIIVLVSIIFVKNFNFIVNDPEAVRDAIQRYGLVSYFIYFLLYIFQIFFAPIPGQVLNIASGMLFGPLKGFLVSWLAVIVGGFLAMLVARVFGKKILYLFAEEGTSRLEQMITKKGLPLVLFLAIFPNPIGDGLFYLAGLTMIPLKVLIVIIGFCRIPGILIYVVAGDRIMAMGIKGWVMGGVGFLIALILYFLLRKKVEEFFEKHINKFNIYSN
ncbi:MAG: VTT domain-containing protein [candidate division WOR-3 bacterium]